MNQVLFMHYDAAVPVLLNVDNCCGYDISDMPKMVLNILNQIDNYKTAIHDKL